MEETVFCSFKLPKSEHERLKQIAKAGNPMQAKTISWIIRDALVKTYLTESAPVVVDSKSYGEIGEK